MQNNHSLAPCAMPSKETLFRNIHDSCGIINLFMQNEFFINVFPTCATNTTTRLLSRRRSRARSHGQAVAGKLSAKGLTLSATRRVEVINRTAVAISHSPPAALHVTDYSALTK